MEDIQKRVGAYWSKRASEFSEFRIIDLAGPARNVWSDFIKENLPDKYQKGEKIKALDCATGAGFFAFLLADLGCETTGVDYSQEMVDEAESNAKKLHYPPITFRQMDAQEMDFPDETFDFIISRNMTWTVPHPDKVYAEWLRVLKPGGVVVNIDANYGYVFRVADDTGWTDKQNEKWGKDDDKMNNLIGTRPDMIRERNDITRELAITNEVRPGWDLAKMLELGFSEVAAKTDIYGRLFPGMTDKMKSHGVDETFKLPEDAPDTRVFCVRGVK